MKTIAFFLEEPSSKVFLDELIKKNFHLDPQGVSVVYSVYEGKQDLEKNLEKRLKHWNTPDTIFIIMRDQDSGNCKTLKESLKIKCCNAGKENAIVRIACHELESFFLGDLSAVGRGLNIKDLSKYQKQRKFRDPDKLEKPSQEIELLIKSKLKRKTVYLKMDGARRITPFMNPFDNKSHSFCVLYHSLGEIFEENTP
jgi:hypothetical protein